MSDRHDLQTAAGEQPDNPSGPAPASRAAVSGLLAMNAGLSVWALCFVVLYAVLSLGCRYAWHAHAVLGIDALTVVLVALWAGHLVWLGWLIHRAVRRLKHASTAPGPDTSFLRAVTASLHGCALAASVWTGFPVLVLPPCT